MKKLMTFAAAVLLTIASCADQSQAQGTGTAKEELTFPLGEQLPSPPFSGEAYINRLIEMDSVFNFPATNCITFAPGAHSQWHRHGAMVVIGISGIGLFQEDGKEPRLVYPGDVVEIPAGAKHFHGATAGSWFQQFVIYDAAWQTEAQADEDNTLTDEQYAALMPKEIPAITAHTDSLVFAPGDSLLTLPTFTCPVRLSNVLNEENVAACPGLHYVVFEPGVYNAWHTHAGGQMLICTDGIGYHQIEGQPVEVMHPGDVAKCPPNVKHWHGAAPGSRFTHLAANTNPARPGVEWFDFISKEEYDNLPKE